MGASCSVDGGCSSCSFGQRLTALNEESGEEWPVILVRFRESSRTRFFAPGAFTVRANDWVVVDTGKGEEAGKVIAADQQVRAAVFAGPLKPVRRLAEPHEVERVAHLEGEAKAALLVFREQLKRHRLPLKPIRAEFSFDGKQLTFYYSVEGRVDFRALVRDLARHFGLRIELRQVGARDEARLLGGVGKCGRSLCCSSWLQTYPSVTVRQAKEQDLSLNPTKISGVCGRLLCCLSYENEQYSEMKRALPRLGQFVTTPQGPGKVIGLHTLRGGVTCFVEGAGVVEFPAAALARTDAAPPAAPGPEPRPRLRVAAVPHDPDPAVSPPFAGLVDPAETPDSTLIPAPDADADPAAPPRAKRARRRGGRRAGRRQEGPQDG